MAKNLKIRDFQTAKVLTIALKRAVGLTVTPEDDNYLADHLGQVSELWCEGAAIRDSLLFEEQRAAAAAARA